MSVDFSRFKTLTNDEFDIHLGVAKALRDVLPLDSTFVFVYEGTSDGHEVRREVSLHNAADENVFYKSAVSGHGHYNDMFGWQDLRVTANGVCYPIKFDAVTDLPVGAYGTADVAFPECYTLGKVSFTVDDTERTVDVCRSFANFILLDGVLHGPLIVHFEKSVHFKSKVTGQISGRLGFVDAGAVSAVSARAVAASVAAIFPDSSANAVYTHDGVLVQGVNGDEDAALTPGTLGALIVLDAMVNAGTDRPLSLKAETISELLVLWPHDEAGLDTVDGTVNVLIKEDSYTTESRNGKTLRKCQALEDFFKAVQRMDSDDPVLLMLQTLHADEQLSVVLNAEVPIYEPRGQGVSCWVHSLAYVLMTNLFDDARYSLFHHFAALFVLFASKFLRAKRVKRGTGQAVEVSMSKDGLIRAILGDGVSSDNAYDNAELQGPTGGDDSIWMSLTGDVGEDGPFHLIAKGCTVFSKSLGFGDDFVVNAIYEEPIDVLKSKLFVTARPRTAGGVELGTKAHAVVCARDGDGTFTVVYDPLRKLEGVTFTASDRPGAKLAPNEYEGAMIAAPVRVNYNGSIVVMNGGDALTRDNFEVFGG